VPLAGDKQAALAQAAWEFRGRTRRRRLQSIEASVVTGALFLLATFFTPLVAAIPSEAAVPALVLVGFLMMQQVTEIDWRDLEVAIPAFLTVVLMPFTYSISVGIGAGFVAYVFIKVVVGKAREVHPIMWVVAALFVIYFAYTPISGWLS
jgi:AGZA family xanthine/uracil permease-like MFS transporter